MTLQSPQQPNTLGKASLALGVASVSPVFGIGPCALVGTKQGWVRVVGTALHVCRASSAFLGFVSAVLGIGGLFGANRSRAATTAGLVLGLGAVLAATGGASWRYAVRFEYALCLRQSFLR